MTVQNNTGNDPLAEPTIFSAIITPHRSLSGRGFLLVMALVGGLSFAGGMFFFLMGAWPVIGFLGSHVGVLRALSIAAALLALATVIVPATREPDRAARLTEPARR